MLAVTLPLKVKMLPVGDTVKVVDVTGDGVNVGLPPVPHADREGDTEGDPLARALRDTEAQSVDEGVTETLAETHCEVEREPVPEDDPDSDTKRSEEEGHWLEDAEREAPRASLVLEMGERLAILDCDSVEDAALLGVAELVEHGEGVPLLVSKAEFVGQEDVVPDAVAVTQALAELDKEAQAEAVWEEVTDAVAELHADAVAWLADDEGVAAAVVELDTVPLPLLVSEPPVETVWVKEETALADDEELATADADCEAVANTVGDIVMRAFVADKRPDALPLRVTEGLADEERVREVQAEDDDEGVLVPKVLCVTVALVVTVGDRLPVVHMEAEVHTVPVGVGKSLVRVAEAKDVAVVEMLPASLPLLTLLRLDCAVAERDIVGLAENDPELQGEAVKVADTEAVPVELEIPV